MKKNKNRSCVHSTTLSFLLVVMFCFFYCRSYGQLIVYNSGVTTSIESGLTVTIQGSFTNQVQAATNGSVDNQGTLAVSGGWTNTAANNVFTTAAGLVTLNGTAAQTIGGTSTTNFYDLTLNNSFATIPQFTLGIGTTVRNTLTMALGKVNLAAYTLTLGTAASTPGTLTYTSGWLYGGTFTRYVNTPVVAIGNAGGHFPMGSAADYRPFWVGYSALATGGTISLAHTGISPPANTIVNIPDASWGSTVIFTSKTNWTLSTSGISVAGSPFTVRMEGTGMGPVAAVADLNLTLSGSIVGTYMASGGTITNPQVNRTGLTLNQLNNTGTSQSFYFGSKSSNSPLPISLLSFNAMLNHKQVVDLYWITASETNNDYFTIEKTMDGIHFEEALRVKGAGNSTVEKQYSATDTNPYKDLSYYRLKQTDFNGKYTYSKIVPIKTAEKFSLNVFPNPLGDGNLFIGLQHSGAKEIQIAIYDMLGKICFSKTVYAKADQSFAEIDFVQALRRGVYTVSVSTPYQVYKQKLIKN